MRYWRRKLKEDHLLGDRMILVKRSEAELFHKDDSPQGPPVSAAGRLPVPHISKIRWTTH